MIRIPQVNVVFSATQQCVSVPWCKARDAYTFSRCIDVFCSLSVELVLLLGLCLQPDSVDLKKKKSISREERALSHPWIFSPTHVSVCLVVANGLY